MLGLLTGLGIAGGLGGSSLIGQLLNYSSAQMTNSTSRRIARDNRQWMERMANTAHQREVEDLRAAGLNPILSATGGAGAAVPSADTSSHLVAPSFGDFGASSAVKGLATAYEMKKSAAAIDLAQSQAEESASAAEVNKARAATQRFETDIKRAEAAYAVDKHLLGSKKAMEEYRKSIADADIAWDKANMVRRDWNFENSAYGRHIYRMKRTKEAWKNSWVGDVVGTLDSDIQGITDLFRNK